eukprot:gene1512-10070_t
MTRPAAPPPTQGVSRRRDGDRTHLDALREAELDPPHRKGPTRTI